MLAFAASAHGQSGLAAKSNAEKGAESSEPVGKAIQIRNTVTGSHEERQLKVSDAVFGSEIIAAAERSHGELILNDNSKVIVGENSEISLDDFVIAENGFKSATLNVAKGAFRFISGESPKGTFTIKTPLSTIGVRGTTFDVYVGEGGVTSVVLMQGAVRVCSTNNSCVLAERSCDIVVVESPDRAQVQPFFKSAARSGAAEQSLFTLLFDQNRFDRRFRAPTAVCNSRAANEAFDNGSNDNSSGNGGNGGNGGRNPNKN
jgi:hypothetical protein